VNAGRHDEALAQFRESAKDYPGALFALGTELVAAGEVVEGTRALEGYIRAQPDNAIVIPTRELLSSVYMEQNRLPEASTHLRLLLERVPNHAAARRLMGDLKMRQNDAAGAVVEYRESLRVQPGQAETLGTLGYALASLNRFDEAAVTLREAVARTPTDPSSHLLLGRVLSVLKKYDEAMEEFKAAVELDPENRDAKTNLESLQRLMAKP
jgi:predicted Zn-dependent protease